MRLEIKQGDVLEKIKEISNDSIDLVITSPPYWGLRSYDMGDKELGKEPTMEAYLDNTMRWVREAWRILKPTGNFALNIGDCFIGEGRGDTKTRLNGKEAGFAGGHRGQAAPPDWNALKGAGGRDWKASTSPHSVQGNGNGIYKTKQLLSVSSFAYCRIVSETDFVCRNEMIWCKPNVPSPIRSRLKHSHEKLFWFVKDVDKYYFDAKAWMKKVSEISHRRGESPVNMAHFNSGGQDKTRILVKYPEETIEHSWRIIPVGAKQSGFELAGKQISEHIAPYPEELIRPYIKSMCPPNGTICDPFAGSFTTARVCLEERRNCVGIELSESSIRYAKKRLNWKAGLGCEYVEG